ncbi:MAG: T9SS type A sorting domain-containing protein [Saprospiraceae bacterium]
MNRFILGITFLFLTSGTISGQDYVLCNQVIGAAGNAVVTASQRWAFTVGEVAIQTLTDTMLMVSVTQGFHQPELCTVVSTNSPEIDRLQIQVYPNPASAYWQIDCAQPDNAGLQYTVLNALGQTLATQRIEKAGATRIDCAGWQPGIYLLLVTDAASKATGTLRLLKI